MLGVVFPCTTSQKARTLQHPVALGYGGWCQNEDIGGVLTCHQLDAGEEIFLPSCKPHAETNSSSLISRNHNFIYLFFFPIFFPFGEVHICFTFITCLHYVLLCAAEQEPRTSCREIQSEQLLLFQHVSHSCFSSVISLFFFFFLPFSSFLSQTRTNTVRLAGNWQASTIQRQ